MVTRAPWVIMPCWSPSESSLVVYDRLWLTGISQTGAATGGMTMGPWPEQADVRTDEGGWLSGPSVTVVDPKKIARVLGLYGRVLTGEEIRAIAMIETEFDDEVRPWHVYPGIGPDRIFYARRQHTVMQVLMGDDIPDIYEKVKAWMSEHQNDWA